MPRPTANPCRRAVAAIRRAMRRCHGRRVREPRGIAKNLNLGLWSIVMEPMVLLEGV
jgi:hypothetical protein